MTYAYLVHQYKLALVRAALKGAEGNAAKAARALGITRPALHGIAKTAGARLRA